VLSWFAFAVFPESGVISAGVVVDVESSSSPSEQATVLNARETARAANAEIFTNLFIIKSPFFELFELFESSSGTPRSDI
jgi:hypothetical protein